MKVEFDNWEIAYNGSCFYLEMDCCPVVGQEIWVEKSLMPEHYQPELFFENGDHPLEVIDDCVKLEVLEVEHQITKKGHIVRVGFAF